MTLILNGTNGLSDVDGDASTPAVRGTDANTGIFFGADQVGVATNGVERVEFGNSETVFNDGGADVDFRVEGDTDANLLFVDASAESIGIGTSSPAQKLDIIGGTTNGSGIVNTLRLRNTGTTVNDGAKILFTAGESTDGAGIGSGGQALNSADLRFFAGGNTERARITSVGQLVVGATSVEGNNLVAFENSGSNGFGISVSINNSNTTNRYFEGYSTSAAAQKIAIHTDGNIRIAAGSTYGNFSDKKLKENIVDATPKLNDVCALQVRNFNLKDDSQTKCIGFIAQEFESVFPSLVGESEDETYVDGVPTKTGETTKSIKESALIPILVKALQELKAITDTQAQTISALEARIAALEGV